LNFGFVHHFLCRLAAAASQKKKGNFGPTCGCSKWGKQKNQHMKNRLAAEKSTHEKTDLRQTQVEK